MTAPATATETLWALLAEHDRLEATWRQSGTEEDRLAMRGCWQIGITQPGWHILDEKATPGGWSRCTPTVIDRDHWPEPEHLEYRGACLGCGWLAERSHRGASAENAAVEDANDHTHPGWRQLPVVGGPPTPDAPASYQRQLERWRQRWEPLLPAGWLECGGPIRTHRTAPGNRHVPGRAPGGGYDIATSDAEEPGGQLGLF
jgi:hypothetical protein